MNQSFNAIIPTRNLTPNPTGYAFVDFADHKTAVDIRRQCATDRKILFGRQIRNVDWADVQQGYSEPDPESVSSNGEWIPMT